MSSSTSQSIDPGSVELWDHSHHSHDPISTRTFGFWLYMLSDAMIFAALFAAYGVLDHSYNAAGGPVARDIIHPLNAFWETVLLFSSVLAYGFAMVALKHGKRSGVLVGIVAAFVVGAAFIGMESKEFADLISHGIVPQRSAFLSVFFTLVIYHGLHMLVGLLWMLLMLVQIGREGFTGNVVYRLLNLRLFWHFQAVIWVCTFTFIYLRGIL